jgi:hypothetical protein
VLLQANPGKLANLLWNAYTISKEPAGVEGWPHVLIAYEGGGSSELWAYGMGRYAGGRGRCEVTVPTSEAASVCITRDEVKQLQSELRGLSGSKNAECTLSIHPDGLWVGDTLIHLSIEYQDEPVAQLADSDPEARGDRFWDGLDELIEEAEGNAPVNKPMAVGFDTLKRLTQLKPDQIVIDMVPVSGTTKPVRALAAKVGPDFVAIMGLTDRELFARSAELDEKFGRGTDDHLIRKE